MSLSNVLVFVTLLSCLHFTSSKIREIPLPEELQECYNRVQGVNVDQYVGSLYSWLCEHFIRHSSDINRTMHIINETARYVKELLHSDNGNNSSEHRQKRQTLPPCVRKEYRMLTLDERTRYHNAVNLMKRDTSVAPNRHDAISGIHRGAINILAHGGPGFLGWHRIFLWLYETNLRRFDPSVCVPYWDSTLESQLPFPTLSSLWSAAYMGTPRGPIVTGPFAGWRYPNGAQLIRNVGADGQLITEGQIQYILSRNSYAQIVTSINGFVPNLEYYHNGPHVYIGGGMNNLETAAYDPVFFLHHAYIDYIFERFRARLRSIGVNPETYPQVNTIPQHLASAPTGLNQPQSAGYSEVFARLASYQPVPTCSLFPRSCGDRYLVCQLSTGRCLPTTTISSRKRRSADEPSQPPTTSEESGTCDKEPHYGQPYQNDYCLGNSCNTSQWAMIPVRIVSVRPPKFQSYQSYPVSAGQVDERMDIYAPAAYNQTRHKPTVILKNSGNVEQTYVEQVGYTVTPTLHQSGGRLFNGGSRHSVTPTALGQGKVSRKGVGHKVVTDGVTKALLRAHDSCGRVCQVACKDPYTDEFKICSGAVAVTTEKPLMFGYTLDQAVTSVVDYKYDNECPRILGDNVFIMFLCDYRNQYPFVKYKQSSNATKTQ